MTLDTLIATPAEFGSAAPFMASMLDRYNAEETFESAAAIEEMFIEPARADLRLALPRYVRYPVSWPGYDDSIALASDEPAWRYLVSRRQLVLFYEWLDEGPDSLNAIKRKRYEREWNDALAGISATINGSGGTSQSRTVTVAL